MSNIAVVSNNQQQLSHDRELCAWFVNCTTTKQVGLTKGRVSNSSHTAQVYTDTANRPRVEANVQKQATPAAYQPMAKGIAARVEH